MGIMTDRAEALRRELASLLVREWTGDEGLTLTRPTKAQNETVEQLASDFDINPLLTEMAVLVADKFSAAIQQQGMRPADYWRMTGVPETLAARISAALKGKPPEFVSAFQASMKGRG